MFTALTPTNLSTVSTQRQDTHRARQRRRDTHCSCRGTQQRGRVYWDTHRTGCACGYLTRRDTQCMRRCHWESHAHAGLPGALVVCTGVPNVTAARTGLPTAWLGIPTTSNSCAGVSTARDGMPSVFVTCTGIPSVAPLAAGIPIVEVAPRRDTHNRYWDTHHSEECAGIPIARAGMPEARTACTGIPSRVHRDIQRKRRAHRDTHHKQHMRWDTHRTQYVYRDTRREHHMCRDTQRTVHLGVPSVILRRC